MPETSGLLGFLQGTGAPPFPQMPPSFAGTGTFFDLVADGTVTVDLDDVRAWIAAVGVTP